MKELKEVVLGTAYIASALGLLTYLAYKLTEGGAL